MGKLISFPAGPMEDAELAESFARMLAAAQELQQLLEELQEMPHEN